MQTWLKVLRKAMPEIIGSLIGGLVFEAVLAVIGQRTGIRIWPAIAIAVGCIWVACAYLAFKRTPPLVEDGRGTWQYPRQRRWALAVMTAIFVLSAVGVGYYAYQQAQPSDKIIILVADFDGPDPRNYRVTETVLARLRAALEPYNDVKVEALEQSITEAEGSTIARSRGEKHKAAVVIWGWYGATAETALLSAHFEILCPLKCDPHLQPDAKGQIQTMGVAELESLTLQTRLSTEMAYLSLLTVGLVRYTADDWDGAIASFSDVLSQTIERIPLLDQSTVYFFRGTAYARRGDYDHAIADYSQAIQLRSNCDDWSYFNNRGIAYAGKGNLDHAIADYSRAIQLQPDYPPAYYNRGLAYVQKGERENAIADFHQVLQLDAPPFWQQQVEEHLKALK